MQSAKQTSSNRFDYSSNLEPLCHALCPRNGLQQRVVCLHASCVAV